MVNVEGFFLANRKSVPVALDVVLASCDGAASTFCSASGSGVTGVGCVALDVEGGEAPTLCSTLGSAAGVTGVVGSAAAVTGAGCCVASDISTSNGVASDISTSVAIVGADCAVC